jgi:hypothetical protein
MMTRSRIGLAFAGVFCTGMLCGTFWRNHFTPARVHAQDQLNSLAGCITAVPKSWGDFRGASDYGLAFEDQDGTLRFIQRPTCNTNNSVGNPPTSGIDFQIRRK